MQRIIRYSQISTSIAVLSNQKLKQIVADGKTMHEGMDNDWNIPHGYLQKSRNLCGQLLKTAGPDVLLHGDLHHDNILQNGNDWLAIDPKGVIGESAYEVAAFIRNPIPELLNYDNAPNTIHKRVTGFAELLELPSQRILDWCFVQAVLAWVWAIEDGCDTDYFERATTSMADIQKLISR